MHVYPLLAAAADESCTCFGTFATPRRKDFFVENSVAPRPAPSSSQLHHPLLLRPTVGDERPPTSALSFGQHPGRFPRRLQEQGLVGRLSPLGLRWQLAVVVAVVDQSAEVDVLVAVDERLAVVDALVVEHVAAAVVVVADLTPPSAVEHAAVVVAA